jgi:hypothetical protein
MATLPGALPQIVNVLESQRMAGGTPVVQALQGMQAYMTQLGAQNRGRKPVIVLATDGIPEPGTCDSSANVPPNNVANAAAIAGACLAQGITVSVIGVESAGLDMQASLDSIAAKGGTKAAIMLSTSGNVEQQFRDALRGIQRQALTCDYPLPGGRTVDPDKTNIQFTEANKSETFFFVGTKDDCAKADTNGWFFDDPVAPTKIVLCPDTCSRVQASVDGKIDIVFGCDRQTIK